MITTKRAKITKKGISRKAAKGAKRSYGYLLGTHDWNGLTYLNPGTVER
jgi:hypothetical protein